MEERYIRFCDSSPFLTVGDLEENTRAFFMGNDVQTRMDEMRVAIHYVRNNWNEKQKLIDDAFPYLSSIGLDMQTVYNKDWCDINPKEKNDTSLIELYTEERGYSSIFKFMNNIFRKENLEAHAYNSAALLVELLNIELYNYIKRSSSVANFEGTIYRGMLIPKDVVNEFKQISKIDLLERRMGIPLGFMSASTAADVAYAFINHRKKEKIQTEDTVPLLLKVHVTNLADELLTKYHFYYPNSIVTSLCSVPISNISAHKEEHEVLLRGAFFQLLRFYKDKSHYVVEALMSNANRDHLTTNLLNATNAGKLFGSIIALDKMRNCVAFATTSYEENQYKLAIERSEEKLAEEIRICDKEKEISK